MWLPDALVDVGRLHAFLYEKSPDAAARAAKVILEGAGLLKSIPDVGRPMDDDTGRRELVISFGAGAFVLRYMWDRHDTVVIIRVWHSKEKRP
ncbi:plasmid stabilization system [Chlorobium limicola DSM 245]|uniref:Plasmid stabilization system n=2 Tax=Chlorobium limicola TaxID=1092 RepID=B3EE83_CHLL2|nr:type II toxin-antitoxin system RelE/ParE family toxin [Chlorobium limicola]ACD89217.1 plasmid stabilization system [Chlorobium limicola DSM 245]